MCTVQIRIVFGVYLEVTPDEVRTKLGILGIFSFCDVSFPTLGASILNYRRRGPSDSNGRETQKSNKESSNS